MEGDGEFPSKHIHIYSQGNREGQGKLFDDVSDAE